MTCVVLLDGLLQLAFQIVHFPLRELQHALLRIKLQLLQLCLVLQRVRVVSPTSELQL
eukprot:CAMPEP_0181445804 /NCGR_PEP_ID=MMETSP1110-20121109/25777_1 /TAXON_ID=174948 /ORGANISM="Symbiodinium sp., Strain CCMP421" /LENGTH=57 /DNA_ID=CAMNT_0023569861 /DNA_START=206 /DNA_END=379 /DNA_ORIENTATION=+